jgi:hypothetical protein
VAGTIRELAKNQGVMLWILFKISKLQGNSAFSAGAVLDALRASIPSHRLRRRLAPNPDFGPRFFGYFSSSAIMGDHASGSSWSASSAKRFL